MKIKTIITLAFFLFSISTYGQKKAVNPTPLYRTSAGFKMGNKFQASAKCYINSDMAFDISAGFTFSNASPSITMVLVYHHDTKYNFVHWYYGGGSALAISKNRNEIGATAVFGGEIVTREKFINIFAEIQPVVLTPIRRNSSFTGGLDLTPSLVVSVGARYIFF